MSGFDEYRPPQPERPNRYRNFDGPKRKKKRKRPGAGAQDGSKEERMAEDFEFSSYYGRPVVKAPPWEWPIGGYFFLGGIAGGSGLLATGAQAAGNEPLRRTTRVAVAQTFGSDQFIHNQFSPVNVSRSTTDSAPKSKSRRLSCMSSCK